MAEILPDDTEIVVLKGDLKGEYGIIQGYYNCSMTYEIFLPELDDVVRVPIELVAALTDREEFEEEDEDEDVETPGFGMSANEFAQHLEFLITRSLERVPTVGPSDAFFGYQEFESLTAEEVLLELLDKIESGIAHLTQAHILISRIGVSYRTIMKEITGDESVAEDE